MNIENMAFDEIVEAFQPLIKKQICSLRIYKNYHDFYQEGLIGLWEAIERFNPQKGYFPPFAAMTIRGRLLTKLRKENHYDTYHEYIEDEQLTAIKDNELIQPLENEMLNLYCQNLSEKQRLWVELGIVNQLKPREIANLMNVPVENVKGWRKEALKKLRKNALLLERMDI